MNRTVIFQTYWNTFHEIAKAERCLWYPWARSGAGNGEPGAELELVIIKCLERGGEIVGAPLRSHRLLCRIPPHKCGFLLMTVLLQDLTQSNSSLPVTKDTVTVCQAIVVVFFINTFFLIILCSGPPSSGEFLFGPMPNLLADPCSRPWEEVERDSIWWAILTKKNASHLSELLFQLHTHTQCIFKVPWTMKLSSTKTLNLYMNIIVKCSTKWAEKILSEIK